MASVRLMADVGGPARPGPRSRPGRHLTPVPEPSVSSCSCQPDDSCPPAGHRRQRRRDCCLNLSTGRPPSRRPRRIVAEPGRTLQQQRAGKPGQFDPVRISGWPTNESRLRTAANPGSRSVSDAPTSRRSSFERRGATRSRRVAPPGGAVAAGRWRALAGAVARSAGARALSLR